MLRSLSFVIRRHQQPEHGKDGNQDQTKHNRGGADGETPPEAVLRHLGGSCIAASPWSLRDRLHLSFYFSGAALAMFAFLLEGFEHDFIHARIDL